MLIKLTFEFLKRGQPKPAVLLYHRLQNCSSAAAILTGAQCCWVKKVHEMIVIDITSSYWQTCLTCIHSQVKEELSGIQLGDVKNAFTCVSLLNRRTHS